MPESEKLIYCLNLSDMWWTIHPVKLVYTTQLAEIAYKHKIIAPFSSLVVGIATASYPQRILSWPG